MPKDGLIGSLPHTRSDDDQKPSFAAPRPAMAADPRAGVTMQRVQAPDDVPSGTHYAVLVYKTTCVHVPGDERSRQAPGHGYPAHTVTNDTFEHWVTADKRALEAKVRALTQPPRYMQKPPEFVVLRVERLAVETRTEVSFKG